MKIKNIFIILLIFLSSCGYKAVNNLGGYNFAINEYELSGDKKINFILENNFKKFKSNEKNKSNFKILANSKKKHINTF